MFPWWAWIAFLALVLGLLAIDLSLLRSGSNTLSRKKALAGCLVFIAIALAFGGVLWRFRGPVSAQQYVAGYLIELALSADNLFVFMIVFDRFGIAPGNQKRVLFWGIIGAMLMRGLFIMIGVSALRRFHGILFVFGAFLVILGIKMVLGRNSARTVQEDGAVTRFFKRLIGARSGEGTSFFIVEGGRRVPTTLFLVLLIVETTDLIFALDSLPAVLAVTTSGFIAVTSNIFAILSLRSLYVALNATMPYFRYLKVALAVILAFVGAKMLLAPWIAIGTPATLGVILVVLGAAAIAQWLLPESSSPAAKSSRDTIARKPPPTVAS